jgi:hypothetical protein
MKILARVPFIILRLAVLTTPGLIYLLGALRGAHGAEFFCPSGNAAINEANARPGKHIINLEPGIYTLQMLDNMIDGPNGLPSIRRSIRIKASADDSPTIIERDPSAPSFRILRVSVGGELNLEG